MNTRLPLGISLLLGISTSALWTEGLRAADAPIQNRAANVALAIRGARLSVTLPAGVPTDGAPRISQALLSEGDPLGCELPAGTTSMVVALPQAETLHQLDFLNLTAAGDFSVSTSNVRLEPSSPRWREVVGTQSFAQADDVVTCDLGAAEARYVCLTFNLAKAGRIDTLGLFGKTNASNLLPAGARPVGGRAFVGYEQVENGNASAQARVVKVSSGDGPAAADRMLDGNLHTDYTFSPTDRNPTAVIDLGANRTLTRTSVAFHAGPGRLDFYLTPDTNPHTSIVRRNASYSGQTAQVPEVGATDIPDDHKPVATMQSDGRAGLRRATLGLSGQTGRYLVLVFTPSGDTAGMMAPPRPAADFKDFKDGVSDAKDFKDMPAAASESSPFSIAEITAFGPPPTSITTIPQLPPPDRNAPFGPPADPIAVITP